MTELKQIKALARASGGKGAVRAVRRAGRVPGVIYGGGEPPIQISLPYKETNILIYAGHFLTTVFNIEIDGKVIRAIPRDYQLDVVRDTPIHVDFLRIGAGQRIRLELPVHFIGEDKSPGLKRGGTLNVVRHTVECMVPADAIPDYLTVDLSSLDINGSAHISLVKLPEGVTPVIQDRDFTIATIAIPSGFKDEAAAPAADAPAAKA